MQFNDGNIFPGKCGRNGNNTALVNGDIHILENSIYENGPAGQQQTHDLSPPSECLFDTLYYRKGGGMSMVFSSRPNKKTACRKMFFRQAAK